MADHAILSASASHRWLACPPSAMLERQFPAVESVYAAEGTAAHELAALTAQGADTSAWTSEFYNQEMQEACDLYAETVKTLTEEQGPDAVQAFEFRVAFDKWVPDGFGTADCLIVSEKQITVIDFKYGKGARVEAENNSQMRLYALGAYEAYRQVISPETIKTVIVQPRIAGGISSETLTLKDLLAWGKTVKKIAAQAAKGEGEFNPSFETCRFCRAKAQCKARAKKNLEAFDEAPDASLLTVEEAGALLTKADDLEAWLSDLRSLVTDSLLKGAPVSGWKLVEGRSLRKFTDEQAVVNAMTAAGYDEALLYDRNLRSLSQLEKDFGKKTIGELLSDYITKPAGKPTLAPVSDKRPEYTPTDAIINAFDNF